MMAVIRTARQSVTFSLGSKSMGDFGPDNSCSSLREESAGIGHLKSIFDSNALKRLGMDEPRKLILRARFGGV
jgi:hypothetical protein